MRGLLAAAIALAAVTYPLLLWLLLDHLPGGALIAVFACLVVARLMLLDLRPWQRAVAVSVALGFCLVAVWSAQSDASLQVLRLYPVLVSLAGGIWFAWTLSTDSPAAARLARLAGMTIPPERDGYLRVVTGIWVAFFVANAGVSAWTTGQSPAVWALYNGLISYLLMAILFAGEYLVRRRLQAQERSVEMQPQPQAAPNPSSRDGVR